MTKIFGEFVETLPQEVDTLELSFNTRFTSHPNRWQNHRLSAYFLADYVLNLLDLDKDDSQIENRTQTIKTAVSYISNELLENAIKFNADSQYFVKLGLWVLEESETVKLIIYAKNTLTSQQAEKFQAFIQELLTADLDELYIQQVEKAAEDPEKEASGLGLLTIVNDYSAKLGWNFTPESSNYKTISVITEAQIVV